MRLGARGLVWSGIVSMVLVSSAGAQVLTADRAVQLALQNNSNIIGARANVLSARSGLYSAYSRMLPTVDAGISRSVSGSRGSSGTQAFGSVLFPQDRTDQQTYRTSPSVSGSWNVLDFSALQSASAARTGVRASRLSEKSTRQQTAFDTRNQFYAVVRSIRLAEVSASALRLARDNERRVRALFEVGSVSRSDLLKAQVATAQAEFDSINTAQTVVSQRNVLAQIVGVPEAQLGAVDTTLTAAPIDVDEAAVRVEAAKARPDLQAAEAELRSARGNLRAANLSRLPAVSANGSYSFSPFSTFRNRTLDTSGVTLPEPFVATGRNKSDNSWSASIGVTLPIFTGGATESRILSARASLLRAEDTRNALQRNLDAEVHLAVVQYQQALVQDDVARQAVASAEENLKLTQQKYNVGSATILDLIDAQVQLQRAQSDAVSALANIRVAEAAINRVRGRE